MGTTLAYFCFLDMTSAWLHRVAMAGAVEGETCSDPTPSANFTYEAFEGTWYEVGKYQVENPFGPITSNAHLAIPLIGTYEGVEFLAEFDCVHHLLGDISYCYHVFVRNADGSHPQGLIEFAQSFAAKA